MITVFVIGATGYIGSAFSERLLKLGCEVIGSARTDEAIAKLIKVGIKPVLGSFEQPESWIAASQQADVIIYAAYNYNDSSNARKELDSQQSHLTKILQTIEGTNKTFVLISGGGVIWDSKDIVYEETTPLPETEDLNTRARRALEQEVLKTATSGVKSIVLRPPIVYGRGGSLLIPRFLLDYAINNRESFYIENCQNNKWSTVHIDDLTDLLLLALNRASAGSLYYASAVSGVTTIQIAEAISFAAGLNGQTKAISLIEARNLSYAPGKNFEHWADWWAISNQCSGKKAKRELNWHPQKISLLVDIKHGSYKIHPTKNTPRLQL